MEAQTTSKLNGNQRINIVVSEGRVTLDDLHKSLDLAIKQIPGGCLHCGLVGFDLAFLRGDPELTQQLAHVPNIQGGFIESL